ncbi:MAG: choice-of-anchor X domain-containing protein [bacterium]|nr:choice-of-anchor X domain-containing protein [bacterium]MDZ4299774.1 choice-of-anchor X domain-containing protein [Candidatus Sungbacteria bacterium]
MQIKWHEVTWYSKVLALVVYVVSLVGGFWLGVVYGRLNIENIPPAELGSSTQIIHEPIPSAYLLLAKPTIQPSIIVAQDETLLTVTVPIRHPELLKGDLMVEQLESISSRNGTGPLRDDGKNGDVKSGDGIFTVRVLVKATKPGQTLFFRISYRVRNRDNYYDAISVYSDLAEVRTVSSVTVQTDDRNLWGTNEGDYVYVQWADYPTETKHLIMFRADSLNGPWKQIFDFDAQILEGSHGGVDRVDGTLRDLYYRFEAQDGKGKVLMTSSVLRVPKYVRE